MIKFLISVLLLTMLFTSCSSEPTKSDAADKTAVKAKQIKTEPAVSEKKMTPYVPPPAPVAKTPVDPQKNDLDIAIASGDDEKIRKTAIELLQLNSKNVTALNALAMYHYKKQQYEAAVLLLNKVLEVNPKGSEIYNNLGLIELAKKNKKEAVRLFRKSLEINSENYAAAANVSSIYAQEKDYNKVIFSLEKSVNNNKANVNSLNNYAIALVATGKAKDAGEIYEKILKDSPDNKNVMLNYSILLIEKQDKFKEGLDLVNRLKFVGLDNDSRQIIKELEIKAKAGLK